MLRPPTGGFVQGIFGAAQLWSFGGRLVRRFGGVPELGFERLTPGWGVLVAVETRHLDKQRGRGKILIGSDPVDLGEVEGERFGARRPPVQWDCRFYREHSVERPQCGHEVNGMGWQQREVSWFGRPAHRTVGVAYNQTPELEHPADSHPAIWVKYVGR